MTTKKWMRYKVTALDDLRRCPLTRRSWCTQQETGTCASLRLLVPPMHPGFSCRCEPAERGERNCNSKVLQRHLVPTLTMRIYAMHLQRDAPALAILPLRHVNSSGRFPPGNYGTCIHNTRMPGCGRLQSIHAHPFHRKCNHTTHRTRNCNNHRAVHITAPGRKASSFTLRVSQRQ
jgi:hypothetical protein